MADVTGDLLNFQRVAATVVYVESRLAISLQIFLCFRKMPRSVYEAVDWARVWPHATWYENGSRWSRYRRQLGNHGAGPRGMSPLLANHDTATVTTTLPAMPPSERAAKPATADYCINNSTAVTDAGRLLLL